MDRLDVGDYRRVVSTINYPGRKAAGLKSAIYNYPTITQRRLRAIPASGLQNGVREISAPNDHFTAGPHCRLIGLSGRGRVGSAGGYPTVGVWIVSPAGV